MGRGVAVREEGTTVVRILGLGGSLREGSLSLAALRAALAAAERASAETRLLELRALPLPFFRGDFDTPDAYGPEAAAQIARLLTEARRADGLLWASPAYHGAVSGAFKNALDFFQYLSRDEPSFLYGKVVGVLAVGLGTIGAVNVVAQLTQIAHALRAQVVPLTVPITFAGQHFDDRQTPDAPTAQRLAALGAEIVAQAAPRGLKVEG
ncbi:MAG TPA: NADPH-dependent FMN reductase [Thermomicrobiales bacterium]|nr:NADPH-dependent FMN reductase [Thermomicrobiales bacterium]